VCAAPIDPLSWQELEALAPAEPDRVDGATNAQATLRLFGQSEAAVRVTLFRDHHAWCPYCQKVWLWLEEKRIPYRIRKVTMVCYGEKEAWFKRLVPSGMLPALELDGRLITESDVILQALEAAFGPLGAAMNAAQVLPLRQLERTLFRAWCQWLCVPRASAGEEAAAERSFDRVASMVDGALEASSGPFFLSEFGTADLVFTPYIERMNASLYYYKGYGLKERHPAIAAWFTAMESRPTYLGTQGDFHTHAHDLPPQMGGCYENGSAQQRACRLRVDQGPWPLAEPADPETSQPPQEGAALEALRRVLRHRHAILAVNPESPQRFNRPLRCALTRLIRGGRCPAPPGAAVGLLYLRDRISVPRDMSLLAARALRQALTEVAQDQDGQDPRSGPAPLPTHHRRDQDPRPFDRQGGLNRSSSLGLLTALLLAGPLLLGGTLLLAPTPLRALELRGMTVFQTPPWKLTFRNFYTTVMDNGAVYYFTIELPENAGAELGAVEIQQTTGVDWTFPFDLEQTRAFLGAPRREGANLPIETRFDQQRRLFNIRFQTPPGPGQTVTVALKPFNNPGQAGISLFAVRAFPDGPNPVMAPVGFARLSIYNNTLF